MVLGWIAAGMAVDAAAVGAAGALVVQPVGTVGPPDNRPVRLVDRRAGSRCSARPPRWRLILQP
jgi:hypothetical protein